MWIKQDSRSSSFCRHEVRPRCAGFGSIIACVRKIRNVLCCCRCCCSCCCCCRCSISSLHTCPHKDTCGNTCVHDKAYHCFRAKDLRHFRVLDHLGQHLVECCAAPADLALVVVESGPSLAVIFMFGACGTCGPGFNQFGAATLAWPVELSINLLGNTHETRVVS